MAAPTKTDGRITDEAIARLRARIGIAEPHVQPPHYLAADTDAFRHVAECYGCLLYTSPSPRDRS